MNKARQIPQGEAVSSAVKKVIEETFSAARSLIVEKCVNLTDFTFNSQTVLSYDLPRKLQTIFPSCLNSLVTIDFDWESREVRQLWSGSQVLFLLISLPELESASLVFQFDYEDSLVIITHAQTLVKPDRLVSKVKNLCLRIHQKLPQKDYQNCDSDSTFAKFVSIFDRLENLTPAFIQDLMSRGPFSVRGSQAPTPESLRGLRSSFATLKSLSLEGQADPYMSEKNVVDQFD